MDYELLPESVGYKANLHTHTLDSDGHISPVQAKEEYKKRGFSILAYTDHAFMTDRTYLSDENFIAISGYENHIEPPRVNGKSVRCYHMNFYAPQPDKLGMVGITDYTWEYYNRIYKAKVGEPMRDPFNCPESPMLDGYCASDYTIENINSIIAQANQEGYLVVINHPAWSHNDARDLVGLKGLCGLEIANYDCVCGGYPCEGIETFYDLMLKDGQRINCFANDDSHWASEKDSFGAYNYIYPEKFTYEGVFQAMKKGDLYASTGAQFRGVFIKDGKVCVGSEPVSYIKLITDHRRQMITSNENNITDATFVLKDNDDYFRIEIGTENGKRAFTKGYFLDGYKL